MTIPGSDLQAGRVVLVTGADGGMGRGLVAEYVNHGYRVVAAHHRETSHVKTDRIWPLAIDVTDRAGVKSAVQQITERWGLVSILVNNAGIAADTILANLKESDWDRVMDVNLKGAFFCSQAVLPGMIRGRDGHIVNISSVSGLQGRVGQASYAAAKAGLVGLTRALAKEVGSRNVRVNVVIPGVMATPMVRHLDLGHLRALEAANALGRISRVEEVVRFIAFLTTLQDVSGQVFQLDSRI